MSVKLTRFNKYKLEFEKNCCNENINNTACLNGLRMTAAEKKHQLMLKNGKDVSKYKVVLVVHLKKLLQNHQ